MLLRDDRDPGFTGSKDDSAFAYIAGLCRVCGAIGCIDVEIEALLDFGRDLLNACYAVMADQGDSRTFFCRYDGGAKTDHAGCAENCNAAIFQRPVELLLKCLLHL